MGKLLKFVLRVVNGEPPSPIPTTKEVEELEAIQRELEGEVKDES